MAETWRHAGAVVLGTTVERGAFDTSVLRPDNRWFDTDLDAFLLWDGAAWVHRFADNVVLYDDVGDSPMSQFVGAANEDTISIFLADDAVAGHSDLVIRLADAAGESRFEIQDSATAMVAWTNSDGNGYLAGTLGLGTETVPHGAVGYARLALDGPNANALGPHVQFTTASDNYPLLQVMPWSHDSVYLNFDAYYDGAWKSSDAGSNFQLSKTGDELIFQVSSGNAQGAGVAWNTAIRLDTSSYLGLSVSPSYRLDVYGTDENSSTFRLHRRENVDGGATIRLRADRGVAVAGVAGDDLGYIKFIGQDNAGAATTYAQIDADIVDPASPLEYGRLVLRTTQAGALQSAMEFSTYGLINTLTDLRGTGSNFPDLGTTTLAEKLGNVYLGTDMDVYPEDNSAGLQWRADAYHDWDDHFDGAALAAGWNWAGAPFIGAPGSIIVGDSIINIGLTGAVPQRAFLYKNHTPGGTGGTRCVCAMQVLVVNAYWGMRWDDGTDNNYVEAVINMTAITPTTWCYRVNYRTGGGAVNTVNGSAIVVPNQALLEIQLTGALWANWNVSFIVRGFNGLGGHTAFWQTGGVPLGLAWTPTRIGLVCSKPNNAAWYRFEADMWWAA